MSTVVTISGSPAAGPASDALLFVVGNRISHSGPAIVPLVLRELPVGALSAADVADPDIARAVAAVASADGVVVIPPVLPAACPELLTLFLDLLPMSVLRGKSVLLLFTGDSPPRAPADGALRTGLRRLGAAALGQGCFVPDGHLRSYPDGGVVLDAASALPVAETVDAFLTSVARRAPVRPLPRASGRVSSVAGAPDLTVVRAEVGDPVLAPLLRDLMIEYSTRYGGPSPYTTLTEVPPDDFAAPDGGFLALTEDGETIAGGALRRYDGRTAEVKRVWTSARHRRRGLALRLMAELEQAALVLGYRRIHLTTGRRQPEAVGLYLAAGYLPRFDVAADLGDSGPLAFGKELVPGAGLVDWVEPDDYYGVSDATGRQSATVIAR